MALKQDVVQEQDGQISWTDRVTTEVLHRVKEDRNILHTVKRKEAICIGHILCGNCLTLSAHMTSRTIQPAAIKFHKID